MKPREVLEQWIDAFNRADVNAISQLYADDAVNPQVANDPVVGKQAITQMFETEFANAQMVCIPENIFEDGDWVILEWKDPKGLRGCGFFRIKNDKIIFQCGYWNKLSFHKLHTYR
ncbi:MAG TPA: nuclear transport factor 2 family protein [Chitinophagales bacterium]|nr:nuclear transport factor 2 family protein [Chitinophagales bacterium]